MTKTLSLLFVAAPLALGACAVPTTETPSDESASATEDEVRTAPGINGSACAFSPYNCKLRETGGNRIMHKDGSVDWAVAPNATVLDGNGDPLGPNTLPSLLFNFGQERVFGGHHYVYAMGTSTKSSGWFPLASVVSHDVLSGRVGSVHAHREGLAKMACYAITSSFDDVLAAKKVVHDSQSKPGPVGEAAGDYLPRERANGKRSVNINFNVPGSALGGPAIDHFPVGQKFQRLDVPTDSGRPSIDVPLWSQDGDGKYKTPAGALKFVYGYIEASTGDVRVGWVAYPALEKSSGCK